MLADHDAPRIATTTAAWELPHVSLQCPRCTSPLLVPDLRRESVRLQRTLCTSCGNHIQDAYRNALRQLDEAEKAVVAAGPVFTKVQLFLLEAAQHMGLNGRINSHRLVMRRIYGTTANLRTCLHLGLLVQERTLLYALTEEGREVLRHAQQRYGHRASPRQEGAA